MNNSIRILNLLLVFVSSVCCCSLIDQLRECNITTSTLAKTDRSYVEFKDLRNNKPKKDELMRTVSWYSWKNPVFGVYGLRAKDKEGDSYYFGNVKNNDYGIFRSHSDWLNNEKPCDMKANTTIFKDNEYVKMESVMAAGKEVLDFQEFSLNSCILFRWEIHGLRQC